MKSLFESQIPGIPVRRGKVRDVYDLGGQLLIVASDRISAFDVILPTPIPGKGIILTELSNFWFHYFSPHVRHHLLSHRVDEFPGDLAQYWDQLEGRAVLVKKTQVIPIECVVRGYLAGGGWKEYQKSGSVSGVKLPSGLQLCGKLTQPIFTPSTKADQGHDESIAFEDASRKVGAAVMTYIRDRSLGLYRLAASYALRRGIIIADTKFEWGIAEDSREPILIDEALTPDSSRFWPAGDYVAGREQVSFDKQYVRNYLETLDWKKTPPGPELPEAVVVNTQEKYREACQRLAGKKYTGVS
ncbi:MAG: phosphoribosylaminoimidazolesuccinocarboxamide synthase [Phycisphaerae bacterium]|nr:phosphoribosylaminoimidazolesuccinocarboxamide synthase [Phycisphaerae bacterium]